MKFLIVACLFMLLGCSKGPTTNQNLSSSSEGNQNCKVKQTSVLFSAKRIFDDDKVDLDSFLESFQKNDGLIRSSTSDDLIISKNTKIILTVDKSCLRNRVNEGIFGTFPLTDKIRLRDQSHQMSNEESYGYRLPRNMDLSEVKDLAVDDPCVIGVSKNVRVSTLSLPNDPGYSQQAHLKAIDHEDNYDYFFSTKDGIKQDTIIAVIDNGIDLQHEDLKDHLWINEAEKSGLPGVDDDHNGYVDDIYGYDFALDVGDPSHKYSDNQSTHSHGSHVAGLAAATTNNSKGVAGVMSQHVKIMPLNVFGDSDGSDVDYIDKAIRYAADMGAKIINISLGAPGRSTSTESAIAYAVSKGTTVVVAAGNDSDTLSDSQFYTPASYGASIEGMITVGATDANANHVGRLCDFSNRSTTFVELGAPGCDTSVQTQGILSVLKNNKYGMMAGTSMASPVAAGAAALVYSFIRDHYQKTLTPAELESFLEGGSKNFTLLNSYVKDGKNLNLTSLKIKINAEYGQSPSDPEPSPHNNCP